MKTLLKTIQRHPLKHRAILLMLFFYNYLMSFVRRHVTATTLPIKIGLFLFSLALMTALFIAAYWWSNREVKKDGK